MWMKVFKYYEYRKDVFVDYKVLKRKTVYYWVRKKTVWSKLVWINYSNFRLKRRVDVFNVLSNDSKQAAQEPTQKSRMTVKKYIEGDNIGDIIFGLKRTGSSQRGTEICFQIQKEANGKSFTLKNIWRETQIFCTEENLVRSKSLRYFISGGGGESCS